MKGCYFVTDSAADAMQVWCYPTTRSPQHFRLANSPSNGWELGVVWHDAGPSDEEPTFYSGALIPMLDKVTLKTLGKFWCGVSQPAMWAVHIDLTIKPVWKMASGENRVLEACIRRQVEDSKIVLAFAPDHETWVTNYKKYSSWDDDLPAVVKIRFEAV